MLTEVTLTWYELYMAAMIGAKRNLEALQKGLIPKYGATDNDWHIHIEGVAGEMAVAKALGVYYSGSINTFKQADVGSSLQIRTRSRDDYELLVRPSDSNKDVFILVTGKSPTFKLRGWMMGKDAKQEKFLQTYGNRPAAYFVPQSELLSITELDYGRFM